MGLVFHGSVPTFADLPASGQQQGDSYIVADENDKLYVWDAATTAWVEGGSIQGPPGPAGGAGPRGTGWFVGTGAPPAVIEGSLPGDLYLDMATGDVYSLGEAPAGIPIGDLPALGGAFEGGFYAGLWSDSADGIATHALVVAPKSGGQTSLVWRTTNTAGSGYASEFDGFTNTEAALAAGAALYPAAAWARGLAIGGYDDWYVPSRYELIALYRQFKPGDASEAFNSEEPGDGVNPHMVPPAGEYGAGGFFDSNPSQTSVLAFRDGQVQAFDAATYASSTQAPTATQIRGVFFDNGMLLAGNKNVSRPTRAIRRVAVIP
ncbi:hypothetical protein KBY96_07695 [Cyanobium sp. ATX 6A2]|uniref:hypothetical protein n=1 Tax=Cyanobium sp. ATX 6A2 TaxID=2823700 RepID=UPI0020CB7B73|nr:hypothetical protein [Cyanobium sp. ATX 6A2]MCP9887813.1 hypothetical protein [Cyanobium sp. ATX 6A2]